MVSCIRGAWKKLCPHLTIDFHGFNLHETLSRERLKCLELARRVGLDEVEEDDVDSLLESISEELSTEELEDLETKRRQLEEEVEPEQYPTAPQPKQMTVTILQGFYGLLQKTLDYIRRWTQTMNGRDLRGNRVFKELSCYEHLLYEKRKAAMKSYLNSWFKKKLSHPEASANDEPHNSEEPYTSNAPQHSTSTLHRRLNVPTPSPSPDVDDSEVIQFSPSSSNPLPQPQQARTSGQFW